MRNIEKSLTSYVKGNGTRINKEVLLSVAHKDANDIINILFNVINKELNTISGSFSLDRVRTLFEDIHYIIETDDSVDRKIVTHRLHKLEDKIERLQSEKKHQFFDKEKALEELEKVKEDVEKTEDHNNESETKQYEFINYLIDTIRNLTYIEYTFKKMPNIVNCKDKEDKSLFEHYLNRYLNSVAEENKEDILYYENLLSLLISQKEFLLEDSEKRRIMNHLNTIVNKMGINKQQRKSNKEQLQKIADLIELIKTKDEKKDSIEQLTKKYNISFEFSRPILETARIYQPSSKENRYQIEEHIITIDKEDSIEIDDALSCRKLPNGNYLLGVHIASVLGSFPYQSDIVQEALSRTSSIYLPKRYRNVENDFNKVIPIFPYEFAANKGSLIENAPRLARTFFFEIAKDGTIVKEQFLKSIITSNKKTSYREIDKILMHGCDDRRMQETVENLQQVSEILSIRYKPDVLYEQVKENREDFSDLKVKKEGSEKIVYQSMLLTGNRVAEYFGNNGFPCLYRVLNIKKDDSQKLSSLVDKITQTYGGDQYKKLYQLINGLYPKGMYASSGEHNGLGLKHYCHCTSELRRGSDIVVELGLETCYDKIPSDKELLFLEQEVEKRAAEINSKQNSIEWFLKDYNRTYQKRR